MNELDIDVTDLHKQFGSKMVLNGVDLQIPRGRVIGLLGLNGSGQEHAHQVPARAAQADQRIDHGAGPRCVASG